MVYYSDFLNSLPLNTQLHSAFRTTTLKWALPFLAVFLPIVLLSVYTFRIASDSVRDLVEAENISSAANLSQLFIQDMTKNVVLAEAYASLPGTLSAVENHDEVSMRTRLKAMVVSNQQIHRAFIADAEGSVWNEFPTASGSYGTDLSSEKWFTAVEQDHKPVVSSSYPSRVDGTPVIAIVVPIVSTGSAFRGVAVFEYDTTIISNWLETMELGQGGSLFLLDADGVLVAHSEGQKMHVLSESYKDVPAVHTALEGTLHTTEYTDPLTDTVMLATFIPIGVGQNTWVVVAEQPKAVAFATLNHVKRNISLAGGALTLFTLLMVIALARTSSKNIKLNAALGEKNRSLDEFASIVSHQLKAPITAIRWTLESMLDGDYGVLEEGLKKELSMLQDVNIGNYHLILDILNISRLDRGVVAMEIKDTTLGELAEHAIRDYLPVAEKAGLYLRIEGDTSITLKADLEKSAQAISNSVSNALKYTKQGGITLKLSTANSQAVIEVTDTGEGMDSETLSQLFSRDCIRRKNASAESSSGLGLYIAKKFMEMQSGDVTVTSEKGKGSTFKYCWKIS